MSGDAGDDDSESGGEDEEEVMEDEIKALLQESGLIQENDVVEFSSGNARKRTRR